MSLIKQTHVKNRLSVRHRTEIHLAPTENQSNANGLLNGGSASGHPIVDDLVEEQVNLSIPSEPETARMVITTSAKA